MKEPYLTIILNLIGATAFYAMNYCCRRLWRYIDQSKPRLRFRPYIGTIVIWILSSLILIFLALKQIFPIHSILLCWIFITIIFHFYGLKDIFRFWNVGLTGADISIKSGLDYTKALELCRNELSFFGTGAAKLSNNPKFERAMLRCRSDQPIRFLLRKPDDENLKKAAKRAGENPDEYKHMAISSLRKISNLRQNRDLNLEVRFYEEFPAFRLMFIDESICLVSYNVFGEGDGSQLPQIHTVRAPANRQVSTSFYHAFELYFENLWKKSSDWDFHSYL